MNATQSNLALEVLQGLVDAMNQDEDGDFLLFGSNLPLINQAYAVCGYAPAAVMDKSARNIDILSPGFRREDCPPGEAYPDWLNAQLLAAHSEITASLASDQGPRTILVSRPLLEVALANLVSTSRKIAEVHSALYLHLRATRKYEPTYVKTCVPLLDEIWEHLPKDSFAEQRVADVIGGLIEKEPCLQD